MPQRPAMTMSREADIALVAACSLALTLIVAAVPTAQAARIALAIPFILFFPGYALVAALFPRRDQVDLVERIALALGLSIAIVPLIGLALSYSPWGLRLYPILLSLAGFIALTGGVAVVRRRLLSPDAAFGVTLDLAVSKRLPAGWRDWSLAALVAASLAGGGIAAYLIAGSSHAGETFTEFYVLDLGRRATDYPAAVALGDAAPLTLGLANHEGRDVTYAVTVTAGGIEIMKLSAITLSDGDRREEVVSLVPARAGADQKVELLLYRDGESAPYRRLHLWLDVRGRPTQALVGEAGPPADTTSPAATEAEPAVLSQSSPPAEVVPLEQTGPLVHLVAPGDNLTAIAAQYGVSLGEVIAANDLDNPDLIYPAQQILVPAAPPAAGERPTP